MLNFHLMTFTFSDNNRQINHYRFLSGIDINRSHNFFSLSIDIGNGCSSMIDIDLYGLSVYWLTTSGIQVSCTLHFEGSKIYRLDKRIIQQSLINIEGWILNLKWSDIKEKTKNWHGCFYDIKSDNVADFSTLFFILTCCTLKTWFELSRVRLYRNDLQGNKTWLLELKGD